MTSLAIDNTARDSMMQLTGQNQFTRSLSGSHKMTNGSCVRKLFFKNGEAIKESVVRESTKFAVNERVEDGESMAMPNKFYKKQCHV